MTTNISDFEKLIVQIIKNTAKGLVRHSSMNAVRHMEKSWSIQNIDPEMAVFRAITAEEEAATSIFIALKECGYENAKKLKFRNHTYKQAVEPFFIAISKCITDLTNIPNFPFTTQFTLSVDSKDNPSKLELNLKMNNGLITTPIPPLNFQINQNSEPYAFEKELLEVTTGKNRKEIVKNIKIKANLRNELLYASHDGIALVQDDITEFLYHKQKMMILFLKIVCFIFPYKKRSLFVQQTLNAFLLMMGDIEKITENKHA